MLEELKDQGPWLTPPCNFDCYRLQMSYQMETKADSECPHTVEVGEIHKIKSCRICKRSTDGNLFNRFLIVKTKDNFSSCYKKGMT